MSTGRKTVTAFLTIICGLLLVILGLCAGWPLWVWPLVAVTVLGAPLLVVKVAGGRRDPLPRELLLEPDLPIPPLERREQHIAQVALPSREADYDFVFSAVVRWCPCDTSGDAPVINPGALAIDAVLERARRITELRSPSRASLVAHELNGELGVMRPDGSGRVEAMADNVALVLSEHDQARLDKLAAVRKDEAVWEHERKYEQSRRAYLGGDVLQDTGSAVVWWLARNDDQVEKAVKDIGLLAQLSSAANNKDVPEQFQHMVPYPVPEPEPMPFLGNGHGPTGPFAPVDGHEPVQPPEAPVSAADHAGALMEAMGLAEGDPRQALFARQLAHVAAAYASPEEVEELLRRFDTPEDPEPEPAANPEPEPEPDGAANVGQSW
ncbi:hypothetical protein ABVG11_34720 [Streptomyces sp. HD1123-B1]|uniref:hypothetical protein n=1 Tax=Streptomyces huangiella TaxID=3228804 RepID=UPI003D7C623A